MEKQEKQAAQFNKLNATMHKWEAVLANYTAWALSDGILDAAEEKQIAKIQGDINAIKTRLAFLSKKNGIPLLPIAIAAPTVATPTMATTSKEQEITPSETTLEPPNPLEMLASNDETMGLFDKDAEEEDIDKSKFGADMKKWISSLSNQFKGIDKTDETPIIIAELKERLKEQFSEDSLNQFILNELLSGISDDPAVQSRTTIADNIEAVLKPMNNDAYWENLYKENKALRQKYRKDESMNEHLPDFEALGAAIKRSDIEDKTAPNHPDNLKAEEEKKKAEEDAIKAKEEANKLAFDEELKEWNEKCNLFITAVDSLVRESPVSKKLLLEQTNEVFSRITMNPLRIFIENEVKKRLQEDEASGINQTKLLELMAIVKKVTNEAIVKFNRSNDESLFKVWQLDKMNTFPDAGMLRDWAEYSVPLQQLDFAEDLSRWITTVGDAVSAIYKEKTWTKFYKNVLIREVPEVFQYISDLPKEIFDKYLLPEFTAAKNEILSVEELNQIWKKGLDKLRKATPDIYEDYLKRGISGSSLILTLPLSADIGIALDQSEYVPAAPKKPDVEDSLMVLELGMMITPNPRSTTFLSIIDDIGQGIVDAVGIGLLSPKEAVVFRNALLETKGTLIYQIPLQYQPYKVKTPGGEEVMKWFPTPVLGNIEADYADSTLGVTKIALRPAKTKAINYYAFSKQYTIVMDFSLPEKAKSAAVSAASNAVLHERGNEWAAQYSLAASLSTVCIDFEVQFDYMNNQIAGGIVPGTFRLRIKAGESAKFFTYLPLLDTNSKRTLTPFSSK